jgi:hypothetical protein
MYGEHIKKMYESLGLRKFGVDGNGRSKVAIKRLHIDRLGEVVLSDGRFVTIYRPTIDDIVEAQSYASHVQKVILIQRCCEFDDERISIQAVSLIDWAECREILAYLDQAMTKKKK